MAEENGVNVPEEQQTPEEREPEAADVSKEGAELPPEEAAAAEPVAGTDESSEGEVAVAEPVAGTNESSKGEVAPEDSKSVGVVNPDDASEDDAEAAMLAMLEDLPQDDSSVDPDNIEFDNSSVSNASFQQLSKPATSKEQRNIDLLMDVNLPVSIELGRTRMSIADILALGAGSVVELAKLAGEPVDVMVNQKLVARGEVVVVDENFGVRITQLITAEERLQILGEE